MKKKIVVFTLLIGLCYIVGSSFSGGAAASGFNCTGAKGSPTNCGGTTGCHNNGTNTSTIVHIRVDSTGAIPVGGYVPGMSYTVTISATNPLPLSKFGFQFTAVQGTGAGQTYAGTYAGLPLNVASNYYSGLYIVEQTAAINAPVPGTYQEKFEWVAPPYAGTGIITMYLTLLAVNANTFADTADVSGNVNITLLEQKNTASVTSVNNDFSFSAFPNPVNNTLTLRAENARQGNYSLRVFNVSGQFIAEQSASFTSSLAPVHINTTNWLPGIYKIVLEKDGSYKELTVVKQ